MPLITYNNGDPAKPISVNQYHDLLTGVMTDQPVTFGNNLAVKGTTALDNGSITTDGAGNLTVKSITTGGGNLTVNGVTTSGDVSIGGTLTTSGTATLGTSGGGGGLASSSNPALTLYSFFQSLRVYCDSSNGLWTFQPNPVANNARGFALYTVDTSGVLHRAVSGDPQGIVHIGGGVIQSDISFLGFMDSSGNKIGEMKNGTFIIGGHAIANGDGTGTTTFGAGSFDGFDVGELYPTDATYPGGTVVCPNAEGVFTRCTHDACQFAMIVSATPGIGIGQIEDVPNHQYLALSGRVLVDTQSTNLGVTTWVTSDGNGGVRAFAAGESGYTLGFVIAAPMSGQVGIVVRPMYRQA